MAKIIYKEGCEGQNKIERIEGIEIELLNGYKALVFPKYKELPLLGENEIKRWNASELTEIQALKVTSGEELSDKLFKLGSPAAKFVRQFKSDRCGAFDLPVLLTAGEIVDQQEYIDAFAEIIEGADVLRDFYSSFWSCCCYSFDSVWCVSNTFKFFGNFDLRFKLLAVPTKIYKQPHLGEDMRG